jgi:hypothetical protein
MGSRTALAPLLVAVPSLLAAGCASAQALPASFLADRSTEPPPGAASVPQGMFLPPEALALAPAGDDDGSDFESMISAGFWAPHFGGDIMMEGVRGTPHDDTWGSGAVFRGDFRPQGWAILVDVDAVWIADNLGLPDSSFGARGGDTDHTFSLCGAQAGPCLLRGPEEGTEGGGPHARYRLDLLAGFQISSHTRKVESIPNPGHLFGAGGADWGDALVGLRGEWLPSPGLRVELRGDKGGFGWESKDLWHATGTVGARLGRSAWLSVGWHQTGIRFDRGDPVRYSVRGRLGGPFVALEFWL